MEGKLKALFDYQKFEGNPALQQVIDSVHASLSARELSLDEMEWVSAAGVPNQMKGKKDQDADHQS